MWRKFESVLLSELGWIWKVSWQPNHSIVNFSITSTLPPWFEFENSLSKTIKQYIKRHIILLSKSTQHRFHNRLICQDTDPFCSSTNCENPLKGIFLEGTINYLEVLLHLFSLSLLICFVLLEDFFVQPSVKKTQNNLAGK